MKVWINYAEDNVFARSPGVGQGEWVEAEDAGPGLVRLTGWGGSVRLVPGDVVRVRDGQLLAIHELAPVWVFEVITNTPNLIKAPGLDDPDNWDVTGFEDANWAAAQVIADNVATALANATAVDRSTNLSTRLTTESREWFDRFVADSPHVQYYWELRQPGERIDLQRELHDLGAPERPMFDKHGVRLNP